MLNNTMHIFVFQVIVLNVSAKKSSFLANFAKLSFEKIYSYMAAIETGSYTEHNS